MQRSSKHYHEGYMLTTEKSDKSMLDIRICNMCTYIRLTRTIQVRTTRV
jgi:hypothetical protein